MSIDHDALREQVALLAAAYAARLPQRLVELRGLWDALLETPDAANLAALHRQAHTLAGSAGTHGFGAITAAARNLERTLEPLCTGQTPLTADAVRATTPAFAELEAAMDAAG